MNRIFNILKNGYTAFWYSKTDLITENAIRIYSNQSHVNFVIRWDLYYLNLTIEELRLNKPLILILLLREYFLNVLRHIFFLKILYVVDDPIKKNTNYILLFTEREDLVNSLKKYEIIYNSKIIKVSSKKTFYISFKSIFYSFLCFSFEDIFKSKINNIYFKIDTTNLNSIIYLYEGRSVEYRALYSYLKKNGCNLNFFWTKSSAYHYSINELSNVGNLDYPEKLCRPDYKIGNIINFENELYFTEEVLIVLPTFSNTNQIFHWLSVIRKLCNAPRYAFSLHPTAHKNLTLDLLDNEFIDIEKNNYFSKYSNFIGFDSNLLLMASNHSKKVYAIGINRRQIEYLKYYSELNQIYYLKKT